jgi:hypothetical protein
MADPRWLQAETADHDVTGWARSVGLLGRVSLAAPLWAYCEGGARGAGVALPPERVARYVLTGLVRALRRLQGAPPDVLPFTLVLGAHPLRLVARLEAGRIRLEGGRA